VNAIHSFNPKLRRGSEISSVDVEERSRRSWGGSASTYHIHIPRASPSRCLGASRLEYSSLFLQSGSHRGGEIWR